RELLAMHFVRGREGRRSVTYLIQAAGNARRRQAHQEAIKHLMTALEATADLPDESERTAYERDVYLALAPSLRVMKGPASRETEQAYLQAQSLCQQTGDTAQRLTMLEGLCSCYVVRGEYLKAREMGVEALHLAQGEEEPMRLLEAHRSLGTILMFMGEPGVALTHLEAGIALYHPRQHPELVLLHGLDLGVICWSTSALVLWTLGYAEQARRHMDKAMGLAQEHVHPYSSAFALCRAIDIHLLRGEIVQAQDKLESVRHLAETHHFPFWIVRAKLYQGQVEVATGQPEQGITRLRQGLEAQETQGVGIGRTPWLATLAGAYGQIGQPDTGLEIIEAAFAVVQSKGEHFQEAELYRLKGELLSDEAPLQRALTIARQQQAKSLELKAAISLGRLWQQQGKRREAHALMTQVYGWFTEGFDTAALQEARTFLSPYTPSSSSTTLESNKNAS
ncbi:MAG: hypothetical protein ETSY2_50825, partial [Candidatus Entotheonella gemina]